jgi:hypothetical protein
VAGKVDWAPVFGGRKEIDDPKVSEAVGRDRNAVGEDDVVRKVASVAREVDNFGRGALEAATERKEFSNIRRQRTGETFGESVDVRA